MAKSQTESCVCGVGPAESTGKPRSRYCPGGSLPLVSLCWRRPRNPREKNPSLIVSSPALLSLCSYCGLRQGSNQCDSLLRLHIRNHALQATAHFIGTVQTVTSLSRLFEPCLSISCADVQSSQ